MKRCLYVLAAMAILSVLSMCGPAEEADADKGSSFYTCDDNVAYQCQREAYCVCDIGQDTSRECMYKHNIARAECLEEDDCLRAEIFFCVAECYKLEDYGDCMNACWACDGE